MSVWNLVLSVASIVFYALEMMILTAYCLLTPVTKANIQKDASNNQEMEIVSDTANSPTTSLEKGNEKKNRFHKGFAILLTRIENWIKGLDIPCIYDNSANNFTGRYRMLIV